MLAWQAWWNMTENWWKIDCFVFLVFLVQSGLQAYLLTHWKGVNFMKFCDVSRLILHSAYLMKMDASYGEAAIIFNVLTCILPWLVIKNLIKAFDHFYTFWLTGLKANGLKFGSFECALRLSNWLRLQLNLYSACMYDTLYLETALLI